MGLMNNTTLLVTLGAALLAVFIFTQRRASAQDLSADGQVIEQLRKAGSDLRKPHSIEFFLYFPTDQAARAAEKELGSSFSARVERAAKGPEWLLFLTRAMKPTEPELVKLRSTLNEVAARHGGVYDGWGSQVVK